MSVNTVANQPTYASLLTTDYLLLWQGSQSPNTRKLPVSGLGTYYAALAGATFSGDVTLTSSNLSVGGTGSVTGNLTVGGAIAGSGVITAATAGSSGNQVVNFSQFNPTAAATGFTKLPGGLLMQWGTISIVNGGESIKAWPTPFLSAIYSVQLTDHNESSAVNAGAPLVGSGTTLTNLHAWCAPGQSLNCYFLAVGS